MRSKRQQERLVAVAAAYLSMLAPPPRCVERAAHTAGAQQGRGCTRGCSGAGTGAQALPLKGPPHGPLVLGRHAEEQPADEKRNLLLPAGVRMEVRRLRERCTAVRSRCAFMSRPHGRAAALCFVQALPASTVPATAARRACLR